MRRTWLAASALTCVMLVVTGCGAVQAPKVGTPQTQPSNTASGPANPPFYNETKIEVVTPDPSFDPKSADASQYQDLTVYTASGQKVQLNVTKQPVLFTAYWCPHCQRTLLLLNQHRSELKALPIVVSTGFQPGTTPAEAAQIGQQEEQALGLQNYKIYYDVSSTYASLVPQGFPTLVFTWHGQLNQLYGEHTMPIWKQALNGG